MRKPFQGVWSVIQFNWHFYALSIGLVLSIIPLTNYLNTSFQFYARILCLLIFCTTIISLLVTFYIYDLSGLYKLNWLTDYKFGEKSKIVNINAGFDETSSLLKNKFKDSELIVLDFYNPLKHTELSIKRARKAYPPFPNTHQVETTNLPLMNNDMDEVFVIFSAHEIRDERERISLFKELNRILKDEGRIFVTEHIRDIPNFLAYNIGVFHFHPNISWKKTFREANLEIHKQIKNTPFITTFVLGKNGNSF